MFVILDARGARDESSISSTLRGQTDEMGRGPALGIQWNIRIQIRSRTQSNRLVCGK